MTVEKTEKRKGAEPIPREQLDQILRQQGIVPIKSPPVPQGELNQDIMKELPSAAVSVIETTAQEIRTSLSLNIYLDTFRHFERRKWRNTMEREHPGFELAYDSANRLKRSNLTPAYPWFEYLQMVLKDTDAQVAQKINALIERLPQCFPSVQNFVTDPKIGFENAFTEYEAMTPDEKLAVAKQVEEVSIEFLSLVTKPHE